MNWWAICHYMCLMLIILKNTMSFFFSFFPNCWRNWRSTVFYFHFICHLCDLSRDSDVFFYRKVKEKETEIENQINRNQSNYIIFGRNKWRKRVLNIGIVPFVSSRQKNESKRLRDTCRILKKMWTIFAYLIIGKFEHRYEN